MRTGPRPLSVHIALAATAFPGPPGEGPGAFEGVMQHMLLGIRRYHAYPYPPRRMKLQTLWQSGCVRLLSPARTVAPGKPLLLLIPSLINRAYILDLMKERSLLRWLRRQGIETILLDWEEPLSDPGMHTIDGAIEDKILPALAFLRAQAGAPVHVLGYCMGGTMLAGAAALNARNIASLIFLATPWDFHAGSQALLTRVKFWAPAAAPMIAQRGHLPIDWMQIVFASLDPESTARKFARFADMEEDSPEVKIFIAVEDWLNDGVDLPAALAQQPIDDWFLANKTAAGQWLCAGKAVRPRIIKKPSLVIASRKDRLVEFDTAAALAAQLPRATLITPDCGHIGMMAGRRAVEEVWAPIADWVWSQHKKSIG